MTDRSLVLYVGDTTEYLSCRAKESDPLAYLIEDSNLTIDHAGTAYTSSGDISCIDNFVDLLKSAKKIIYAPPAVWSDNKTRKEKYSIAWTTESCIRLAANACNIPVDNLNITVSPKFIDRISEKPQLWVAGCSTTHGIGVSPTEKFQYIVTQSLGLEVTDLSCSGSSVVWAKDQLLNCDINTGDIVIWGLTSVARFPWFVNNKVDHINIHYYKMHPEFNNQVPFHLLDDDHRLYEAAIAIQQVNNFCNKIGAKLILINIHAETNLVAECINYPGFVIGIDTRSSFLDVGDDGMHPGRLTHQHYAFKILEKLSRVIHCN